MFKDFLVNQAELCLSWDKNAALPRLGSKFSPVNFFDNNFNTTASSSNDGWIQQGRKLFSKQLFVDAAQCFDRGGAIWWKDVSLAYREHQRASEELFSNHSDREAAFGSAGKAFEGLAKTAPAATDVKALFLNGAKCYVEARKQISAARCFYAAGKYREAAYRYEKGGKLEGALRVMREYPEEVDKEVVESIHYVAKVHLTSQGKAACVISCSMVTILLNTEQTTIGTIQW
jgi:hypothetical protein